MQNKTEFDVKLLFEDYLSYNYFWAYDFYKKNWMCRILICVIAIGSIILLYLNRFIELFSVISGAVGMVALIIYSVRTSAKKAFYSDKLIQQPVHYVIDDSGIYLSYKESNNKIQWSDLFDIKSNNTGFFLFVSSNKALIIPKKIFEKNPKKLQSLEHMFQICFLDHKNKNTI